MNRILLNILPLLIIMTSTLTLVIVDWTYIMQYRNVTAIEKCL